VKSNNDELVSNVGIVAGADAIQAYAKTKGLSLEQAQQAMGSPSLTPVSQASQVVPNDHLLVSKLVILEGQAAMEAYARDCGKSLAEVQALVNANQPDASSDIMTTQAFGYYYGTLSCSSPQTARGFFNVGRGTINLSFIGRFALVGGGTTDRANTYWNCAQDICTLYGFAQLTAPGDYTNNYEIFDLLNTINVVSDDCGIIA
jgi:hypothetical protein